jgi:hypothetical protein
LVKHVAILSLFYPLSWFFFHHQVKLIELLLNSMSVFQLFVIMIIIHLETFIYCFYGDFHVCFYFQVLR